MANSTFPHTLTRATLTAKPENCSENTTSSKKCQRYMRWSENAFSFDFNFPLVTVMIYVRL